MMMAIILLRLVIFSLGLNWDWVCQCLEYEIDDD